MENTENAETKTAAEIIVGDLIRVSDRLAKYHFVPELEGSWLRVVNVHNYSDQGLIGITLDGLPETCCNASLGIVAWASGGPFPA